MTSEMQIERHGHSNKRDGLFLRVHRRRAFLQPAPSLRWRRSCSKTHICIRLFFVFISIFYWHHLFPVTIFYRWAAFGVEFHREGTVQIQCLLIFHINITKLRGTREKKYISPEKEGEKKAKEKKGSLEVNILKTRPPLRVDLHTNISRDPWHKENSSNI